MTAGISFFSSRSIYGYLCLILMLFCFSEAFSQKELLLLADRLYEEQKYGEAIPLYDKVYEKKKERTVLLRLANANYQNGNYIQAQRYYSVYFRDTVYENLPQFAWYAQSSRLSGKIAHAVKLYKKIYEATQEASAKERFEGYRLYVDSFRLVRSYSLDSNYNCITIDAGASVDTLASPMIYSWQFDDGKSMDGVKVEHCFAQAGKHRAVLNISDRKTGVLKQRDTMLLVSIDPLPVIFSVYPQTARRYFPLELDASGTELPGYEILDYLWDMDNGETSTEKKLKYKYNESGDYRVQLTVIAKERSGDRWRLFSASKKIRVVENYGNSNKNFGEALNEAK